LLAVFVNLLYYRVNKTKTRELDLKIKYDYIGERIVIGNTKLTRRGTVLVELFGIVLVFLLVGFAGGVELGTIKF
jgi:hypothetical protein